MAVWHIALQIFAQIFFVFSLPSRQFVSSPLIYRNPESTLQLDNFDPRQTKYFQHSTLNSSPEFRLNLPGRTTHAEVLSPRTDEFDFTDHVTCYTAPTPNYFPSQTDNRERTDSSEEEPSVIKKQGKVNAATSSVFFRLGNSPVTQYKVVHVPHVKQHRNGGRKKMISIEKARFIGMSRNPPDFNPFVAKHSDTNFFKLQDKIQKPITHINNGKSLQAQFIGKTINPSDFNPFIAKQIMSNDSQFQGKSIEHTKLNSKEFVTPRSNIKSTFPALFIKNVKPKVLFQPQNVTQIAALTLRNSQTSPQHITNPSNFPQQPQFQLSNFNFNNFPIQKSLLSSKFKIPDIQNLPIQSHVPFPNPIPNRNSEHIKIMPSTFTQSNVRQGILSSTFTLPNIEFSSLPGNQMPPVVTHTDNDRRTAQRSIITPTSLSRFENIPVHDISKGLNDNSPVSDSSESQPRKEDSLAHISDKTSALGTNSEFDPSNTDESYFYSYDINSTKQPNVRNFGKTEKQENGRTSGRYYVALPDGRTQVVTYYADETGYHPTVTYFNNENINS